MIDIAKSLLRAGLAGLLAVGTAAAQDCGICAKEVVLNSDLATCFLQEFPQLAERDARAVAVDLSNCKSRGVVEALPSPDLSGQEPDTKFMLTRDQLSCLKAKLEDPDLVLDPSARIELGDCQ